MFSKCIHVEVVKYPIYALFLTQLSMLYTNHFISIYDPFETEAFYTLLESNRFSEGLFNNLTAYVDIINTETCDFLYKGLCRGCCVYVLNAVCPFFYLIKETCYF